MSLPFIAIEIILRYRPVETAVIPAPAVPIDRIQACEAVTWTVDLALTIRRTNVNECLHRCTIPMRTTCVAAAAAEIRTVARITIINVPRQCPWAIPTAEALRCGMSLFVPVEKEEGKRRRLARFASLVSVFSPCL